MINVTKINEELKVSLPSEFMLKYSAVFLLHPKADKTGFQILNSSLFENFNFLLERFLKYYIPENKAQILAIFGLEELDTNREIAFEFESTINLPNQLEEILLQPIDNLSFETDKISILLIDILSAFIKGYLLCRQLKLSYSKNFLFIESVFVTPIGFDVAYETIQSEEKKICIITGEPRSGKTYSAYYLLYKYFIEKEYLIFQCVNLSRFEQLLTEKQTYYKNQKVVIYYEDPFGFSTFSEHEIRRILQKLKEARRIDGLKVIITSRKQLFLSGIVDANDILNNSIIINYQFQKSELTQDSPYPESQYVPVYYDIDRIKLIILKISWLYTANWSREYSRYIHNPNGNYVWDVLQYNNYSPGSIYESFLISSALPTYTIGQIDKIEQCFASGSNDLMKAFTSEVNTFVKREKIFYVKLFFVLPAITIIENLETVRAILRDNYDVIIKHRDILKCQESSPFAKRSFTYYHPMFGEAVDQYLFKHGYKEFLDDPELVLFMRDINSLDEVFVRDFICFLFYLDFVQNASGNRSKESKHTVDIPFQINSAFEKITSKRLKSEIESIRFFYATMANKDLPEYGKSKDIESFVRKKLNESGNFKFFPYLGSVLEHQLFFRLKYFKNESLAETAGSFIIGITGAIKRNKKNVDLISGVFLHAIFANLEYFINYTSKSNSGTVFNKDKIFHALTTTFDVIVTNLSSSKEKLTYLNIALIWLDAIMMKFSELHQFIEETESLLKLASEGEGVLSYKNKLDIEGMEEEKVKCKMLRDKLFEIFDDFWLRINESAGYKDYARGAIAFSLVWHNRWNYRPGYELFIKWIKRENLTDPGSKLWDPAYKDGLLFNAKYHYEYFLARNDAWTRESSIMIWRIDRPRKGANALYESGIIHWDGKNLTEKIGRLDEVDVFTALIKNMFSKELFDEIGPLSHLIGLRYGKNQLYYDSLVSEINSKVKSTQNKLLNETMLRLADDMSICKLKNPFED